MGIERKMQYTGIRVSYEGGFCDNPFGYSRKSIIQNFHQILEAVQLIHYSKKSRKIPQLGLDSSLQSAWPWEGPMGIVDLSYGGYRTPQTGKV